MIDLGRPTISLFTGYSFMIEKVWHFYVFTVILYFVSSVFIAWSFGQATACRTSLREVSWRTRKTKKNPQNMNMYLYLSLWKPKNYWLLRYVYQRLTSSPFKSYSINALQLVSRHPLPLRESVKSIEASKGKRSIAGHLKCFFTLFFLLFY